MSHIHDNRPVLMCQTYGRFALYLESLPPQEVARLAVRALRSAFPNAPDAIGCLRTAWAANPWAQGSYMTVTERSSLASTQTLAEPLLQETLLFAGEATHAVNNGNLKGAWESGIREAERIARRLGTRLGHVTRQEPQGSAR